MFDKNFCIYNIVTGAGLSRRPVPRHTLESSVIFIERDSVIALPFASNKSP